MDARHDSKVAARFTAECARMRELLRKHMQERGLREADGWKIDETVRTREGVTELVLRPLHLRLPSPPDMECAVRIDEPGQNIDTHCNLEP